MGAPFTPITLSEYDVSKVFKHVSTKKTAAPDGISERILKLCADQLVPVFSMIFNLSLASLVIPVCFKKSLYSYSCAQ